MKEILHDIWDAFKGLFIAFSIGLWALLFIMIFKIAEDEIEGKKTTRIICNNGKCDTTTVIEKRK